MRELYLKRRGQSLDLIKNKMEFPTSVGSSNLWDSIRWVSLHNKLQLVNANEHLESLQSSQIFLLMLTGYHLYVQQAQPSSMWVLIFGAVVNKVVIYKINKEMFLLLDWFLILNCFWVQIHVYNVKCLRILHDFSHDSCILLTIIKWMKKIWFTSYCFRVQLEVLQLIPAYVLLIMV